MSLENAISIQEALCVNTVTNLRALTSASTPRRVDKGIYYLEDNGLGRGIWVQYRASSTLDPSLSFVIIPNDGIGRWVISGRSEGSVFNVVAGTQYTLTPGDAQSTVIMSSALSNTLLLPIDSSALLPTGSLIEVWKEGNGETTIQSSTGVTLNGVTNGKILLTSNYSSASLKKRGPNTWLACIRESPIVTV